MTTLIGCRCKSGNIFSRALLIGRGLFLNRRAVRSLNLALRRQRQTESVALRKRRCEWSVSETNEAILIAQAQISGKSYKLMIYILCNFQRMSWKPRIIGRQQTKVCWWPSKRKPPVPIPNTVVKTLSGDNTWRATSWEDNSLPTSKLNKRGINRMISSSF